MKVVKKYVAIEFLKIFLLISIGLTIVFVVVDIFENLGDLTEARTNVIVIAEYFLLHLPQAIYYIVPPSLLFASFLNLGLLTKYNEVTAMRSGGISLLGITSPLLIITFIISISSFFLNDSIVPITNKRAEDIKRGIEGRPRKTFFKKDSLWLKSGDYTLYNIRSIDPDKKVLWRINVYSLSPDFRVMENISADKAVLEDGQWFLYSGIKRVFSNGNKGIQVYGFDKFPIVFPFEMQEFRHAVVRASETRFTILRSYIEKLRREGYEVKRLVIDLYAKTSFPFAGFIMTILGLSFAFHMRRYGGIAGGIGLCILASIIYWVSFSLSLNMGYAGYLPPILSAWSVNIIFLGMGGYIFYSATRL